MNQSLRELHRMLNCESNPTELQRLLGQAISQAEAVSSASSFDEISAASCQVFNDLSNHLSSVLSTTPLQLRAGDDQRLPPDRTDQQAGAAAQQD